MKRHSLHLPISDRTFAEILMLTLAIVGFGIFSYLMRTLIDFFGGYLSSICPWL